MSHYPDELLCDFAEYYGIYDIRSLPGRYAATLAMGLRDSSRVRTALSGAKVPHDTLMMARLIDDVAFIAWTRTKAAQKNQGRPESLLSALIRPASSQTSAVVFPSAEAFDAARAKLLEGSE